jgi:hypothetical protein
MTELEMRLPMPDDDGDGDHRLQERQVEPEYRQHDQQVERGQAGVERRNADLREHHRPEGAAEHDLPGTPAFARRHLLSLGALNKRMLRHCRSPPRGPATESARLPHQDWARSDPQLICALTRPSASAGTSFCSIPARIVFAI